MDTTGAPVKVGDVALVLVSCRRCGGRFWLHPSLLDTDWAYICDGCRFGTTKKEGKP